MENPSALLNTIVQYCGWLLSQVQADGEGGHHETEDLHSQTMLERWDQVAEGGQEEAAL